MAQVTSNLLTNVIFTFHTHRNIPDSPQDIPNSQAQPAFVLVVPTFFSK